MKALLWLTGLLFVAVAAVWPAFAEGLAQFVVVTVMFLLVGVAHLLAQPPLLVVAAAAIAVVRMARAGAGR
ncbi:hypothetical protein ACFYRN_24970 [Streptomyces sp. NPDC005227]|uniref:hypothetical protein n=1 Tax=Streptomyces sp. NPDC005227 TaxID=3364707 RepID=UPI0036B1D523